MDSLEPAIVGPDEDLIRAPWGAWGRTATFVAVASLSKVLGRAQSGNKHTTHTQTNKQHNSLCFVY